jgi:hypothetical protein
MLTKVESEQISGCDNERLCWKEERGSDEKGRDESHWRGKGHRNLLLRDDCGDAGKGERGWVWAVECRHGQVWCTMSISLRVQGLTKGPGLVVVEPMVFPLHPVCNFPAQVRW